MPTRNIGINSNYSTIYSSNTYIPQRSRNLANMSHLINNNKDNFDRERQELLEGQEYLYRELLQLKEQNKTSMEQLEHNQTNMHRTLTEVPTYILPIP